MAKLFSKLSPAKKWGYLTVISTFLAFISAFQNYSAWSDAHNFNGLFGWVGIAIIFGVAAVYCGYKTISNSNT